MKSKYYILILGMFLVSALVPMVSAAPEGVPFQGRNYLFENTTGAELEDVLVKGKVYKEFSILNDNIYPVISGSLDVFFLEGFS